MLEGTEAESMDGTNRMRHSVGQAERPASNPVNARHAGSNGQNNGRRLELAASPAQADAADGDPRLLRTRLTPTAASHGA